MGHNKEYQRDIIWGFTLKGKKMQHLETKLQIPYAQDEITIPVKKGDL